MLACHNQKLTVGLLCCVYEQIDIIRCVLQGSVRTLSGRGGISVAVLLIQVGLRDAKYYQRERGLIKLLKNITMVQFFLLPHIMAHMCILSCSSADQPRVGSGVVRIDPLRFLAGCRKRRLNQALSCLLA